MKPFVVHRFQLSEITKDVLRGMTPKFGYNGFGEFLFYRTYSRQTREGRQERWADVVIRVVEGVLSIRKDWYLKTGVPWDETFWQRYAFGFACAMFRMHWLPPGRGLWAMGTDFVYERGAMSLYNCAYTNITDDMADDFSWFMDSLMNGVGVGFGPLRNDDFELYTPRGEYDFVIPDSREGWCDALAALIRSYTKPGQQKPRFHYDLVRPAGLPIKGFGGIASGPGPLKCLLEESVVGALESYHQNSAFDVVRLKVDIGNKIGVCVVAGNVRRSAELACASIRDKIFLDLKNYELYPERQAYGWMSNNSVILQSDSDFGMLGEIAKRVVVRGEPGYINKRNLRYGRIGKRDHVRPDAAVGFNPCGEIPLEHRETCNVDETLPTMCETTAEWYQACEYATFYASTVSLLPTHHPSTNRVVARNRRIGVSIIDIAGWKKEHGVHKVTEWMRKGYKVVCESNRRWNSEAGVPEALRKTTVKPGGTTPKLPGKVSGLQHPNFDYTIRRVRVQENTPIDHVLMEAGYPREQDQVSANTVVYEFPILQGPAKPAHQVSLWEQAMNLVWVQREWADNAVSNTLNFRPKWSKIAEIRSQDSTSMVNDLAQYVDSAITMVGLARDLIREKREIYETETHRLIFDYGFSPPNRREERILQSIHVYEFDPNHEEDDVEPVLSAIAPLTKSVSLLPQSNKGAYPQMPEEGIDRNEYHSRLADLKPIDWGKFGGSDGIDERYCEGPSCLIAQ